MPYLELSPHVGCPIGCPYCPQAALASGYVGPRLMPMQTFAAALANWPAGEPLSFAGFSEPFLNPDTPAMMALAHREGYAFQVYTTGLGVTDAAIAVLERTKPHNIVVHLPDDDGRMRIPVTERYIAAVAKLLALPNAKSLCHGTPHRALGLVPTMVSGLHTRAGNVSARPTATGPLRCAAAPDLDHPVMLPDGKLLLCCNDFGVRHPIGNLAETPWREIHAGPALAAIRAAMVDGDCLCRTCEHATRAL